MRKLNLLKTLKNQRFLVHQVQKNLSGFPNKFFFINFILLFVSILSLSLVSAQQNLGYNGCFGMMSGAYGFGGGFIFGWIFMILVVIALVLLIIWLIRQLTQPIQN